MSWSAPAGQVVGVEQLLLLADVLLDPGMETGAEPRRRRTACAASAGPGRGPEPPDRPAAGARVVADIDGGSGHDDLVRPTRSCLGDQAIELEVPLLHPADLVEHQQVVGSVVGGSATPVGRRRRDQRGAPRSRRATSSLAGLDGPRPSRLGAVRGVDGVVVGRQPSSAPARRPSIRPSCRVIVGEELRRPARPLLLRSPPVARDDQLVPWPGDGDVAEPALLLQLVVLARLDEVAQALAARLANPWQVDVVAAQRPGQLGRPTTSSVTGRVRTGNTFAHMPGTKTTSHSSPLARCTVSSFTEFASVGTGEREALAVLLLGLQVGEQTGQRRVAVDAGERRHRVEERRDVVAPRTGHRRRRGRELDVETRSRRSPGGPGRAAAHRRTGAALRSSRASCVEPFPRLGRVVGVARVVERLDQRRRRRPGRCRRPPPRARPPRRPRSGSGTRASHLRPTTEQSEVTRADRPARPGQQGEQRGVGRHVVDDLQRRDDLGDLRHARAAR